MYCVLFVIVCMCLCMYTCMHASVGVVLCCLLWSVCCGLYDIGYIV